MTALILVAYATKHGSTQEVAEAIAATLREHALEVEVQPASEVRALDRYGAVLLGAPLYSGRWHGDANRFLKRHRTALGERVDVGHSVQVSQRMRKHLPQNHALCAKKGG